MVLDEVLDFLTELTHFLVVKSDELIVDQGTQSARCRIRVFLRRRLLQLKPFYLFGQQLQLSEGLSRYRLLLQLTQLCSFSDHDFKFSSVAQALVPRVFLLDIVEQGGLLE